MSNPTDPSGSDTLTRGEITTPEPESEPLNTSGPCPRCERGECGDCWIAYCWGCDRPGHRRREASWPARKAVLP